MYEDEDEDEDFGTEGERLGRLMAKRGIASRRGAETLIAEGRVTVNGETVSGAVFVNPEKDVIRIDDRPLPREPGRVYFLMYKPKGYITGRNDPQGRKSVLDLVEKLNVRVEPVGRLDFDTEGALLLTNDGELAHQLLHPSRKVPKRYVAKCYREPNAKDIAALENGIFLDDGKTQPAKARVLETTDSKNAWVEITVTEGKNRLVRRMFAQLGHPVSKLRRESFATLTIRGLERGQVRPLTRIEVKRLQDIAAGERTQRAGRKRGKGFAKPKPKRQRPGQKKPRSR